eukprot:6490902-Amphidinium_carterae.2
MSQWYEMYTLLWQDPNSSGPNLLRVTCNGTLSALWLQLQSDQLRVTLHVLHPAKCLHVISAMSFLDAYLELDSGRDAVAEEVAVVKLCILAISCYLSCLAMLIK